jgi:hypothetical protein
MILSLFTIVLICILLSITCFLENKDIYKKSIVFASSPPSSQKFLNFTFGNGDYLLLNNGTKNLEMVLVSKTDNKSIFSKLIDSKNTDNTVNWLKDYAIPIAVAIIGGIAASWNFIQSRWHGRYFQKLILEELAEFEPEIKPGGLYKANTNLKSYMKKTFIHKKILNNPTENKDYIFNTNHKLIYLTTQLWSAFDRNDVSQFLMYFCYISQQRKRKIDKKSIWNKSIFGVFNQKKYDRKGRLTEAYKKWIHFVIRDDYIKCFIKEKKPLFSKRKLEIPCDECIFTNATIYRNSEIIRE